MAETHVNFNDQLSHGRLLRRALQQLEEGLENLNDVFAFMNHAKDGDGTQAAHFAYLTPLLGTGTDAKTKALYDELNSLQSKLNTNAAVTDVNAALLQAFAKFR